MNLPWVKTLQKQLIKTRNSKQETCRDYERKIATDREWTRKLNQGEENICNPEAQMERAIDEGINAVRYQPSPHTTGHPQFSEEELWRQGKKESSYTNEACVSQNYMNIWYVYSEYINFWLLSNFSFFWILRVGVLKLILEKPKVKHCTLIIKKHPSNQIKPSKGSCQFLPQPLQVLIPRVRFSHSCGIAKAYQCWCLKQKHTAALTNKWANE